MVQKSLPIAVFDSGLGGISVLRACVRQLPRERFFYYGDSRNAPYGVRSAEEVKALSLAAAQMLTEKGIKALVVACNTATSAAIGALRKAYPELIVIGTEPALKPAVERHPGGRILVMATPMTLKEEKFLHLLEKYQSEAEIISVPCGGLMEFVENGDLDGEAPEAFLLGLLDAYRNVPIDAVVLGCTHYPFLAPLISKIVGRRTEILDGNAGIAQQLQKKLAEQGLLCEQGCGGVEFSNSLGEEMVARSRRLFSL